MSPDECCVEAATRLRSLESPVSRVRFPSDRAAFLFDTYAAPAPGRGSVDIWRHVSMEEQPNQQAAQQANPQGGQGGALTRFQGDHFLARKKVFSFLGNKFHIYGPNEDLRFFVKQKAFKLKEDITVFTDESMTTPVLKIGARSWQDFSGTYDVSTPDGQPIGSLKREGLRSIFKDKWLILDGNDQPVGEIEEDSTFAALMRRFLSNLIPQTFNVRLNGQQVAVYSQHFNPFVAKYDIDFSLDQNDNLDRRLGIASVVLLLAIEGRQN